MVWTTVLFGVLLAVLGVVGYFVAEQAFWAALIPTVLGGALLVSGLVALKPSFRKSAMHAAVFVALLGLVGTAYPLLQLIKLVLQQPALVIESVTAVLCAVFMGLAIRSFIEARRRRPAEAAEPADERRQDQETQARD